jgi:hypothetical protein
MNLLLFLLLLLNNFVSLDTPAAAKTLQPANEVDPSRRVVFIAGYDEGDNRYYEQAKAYFQSRGYPVVDSLYSLAEILEWLNGRPEPVVFDEIHIVSHSNPWRGLSLKISPLGARITEDAIRSAAAECALPVLKQGVSGVTSIVFHACGLGEHEALLSQLKAILTVDESPTVYASPWYSIFGAGSVSHHLSKVFYVQYPTAYSPGPYALARELTEKNPTIDIDWRTALETEVPLFPGQPSYYRFNIPVEWTFDFTDESAIPQLENRDDIMDWVVEQDEITRVLYTFNIPLEKFRWRTKIEGRQLTILAKTTVVCILQPIMQKEDPSEFLHPDIHDPFLFNKI